MKDSEMQRLKTQVEHQRVKNLPLHIKQELANCSTYSTLIEQAVYFLLFKNVFNWPLSPAHQKIVDENHQTINNIPRFIKLIILMNYRTDQQYTDFQRLWLYANSPNETPKCAVCGEQTRWSRFQSRFTYHCSNKCRALDPQVNEKRKETCIQKYGHDKSLSNSSHLDQTRQSCEVNNGVEYPLQSDDIREKTDRTKQLRYGENYKQVISNNSLNVLKTKYRKDNCNIGELFNTSPFLEKKIQTRKKRWLPARLSTFSDTVVPLYELQEFKDRFQLLPYKCLKCDQVFKDNVINGSIPRCPNCFPKNNTNV